MGGEQVLGRLIAGVDDIPHLAVDLGGDVFGVVADVVEIAPEEGLALILSVDDRAELFAEAVAGDHALGELGGPLEVVGGAGGDIVEDQRLGDAAAQQGDDLLPHFLAGHVAAVMLRQGEGVAARHAAGDDGDLVDRVLGLAVVGRDGVAALVIGGEPLFLLGDDLGLLFGAGNDLDGRLLDVLLDDGLAALAGGEEGGLVHEVLEVRAGKAGGGFRDGAQVDVKAQRLVAGMYLEDLLAALDVGIVDDDLPVKAAGAQQGGVEDIAAVGRGDDDDPLVGAEAVHLDEQLV